MGNDADIAGYGAIQGQGVELVLTLGTGLGSALFTNGHLVPGLELGHHPWRKKGMTYEDYLGRRGLDKYGKARWNDFLEAAIQSNRSCSSTGTTSTWAAATPKKSSSSPPKTSPSSPTKPASSAASFFGRIRPESKNPSLFFDGVHAHTGDFGFPVDLRAPFFPFIPAERVGYQ